jgi:hypothetical protein
MAMATITKEMFDEQVTRIQAEPVEIDAPVKKIQIDLSLQGILARVQFLAGEAHKKGDLLEDQFKEIMSTADKLKNAVSRFDPKQLLRKIPGLKGKR